MSYGVVAVAAAPVRKKADHRSEMVNQLLFGEAVQITINRADGWAAVKSLHDGYKGWMQSVMLEQCGRAGTKAAAVVTGMFAKAVYMGQAITIPAGSSLPLLSAGKGWLGNQEYLFAGKFAAAGQIKPSAEIIEELVIPWINTPYLWGGRTPMGVDCSGLVQVIFKQAGIKLPRDAWQQAEKGRLVKNVKQARPGDLAFFERNGKIIHVGIILPGEKIIHASGKVKTDRLTEKGIMHSESSKVAVSLQRIRRIL